jgi:hypothetical protein
MKLLAKCQTNSIQSTLQKIDRKSKPIKKYEKVVNESLLRKNIFLEQENFDILTLLKRGYFKEEDNNFGSPLKEFNSPEFQMPLNIQRGRPLKSDKDRKAAMDK